MYCRFLKIFKNSASDGSFSLKSYGFEPVCQLPQKNGETKGWTQIRNGDSGSRTWDSVRRILDSGFQILDPGPYFHCHFLGLFVAENFLPTISYRVQGARLRTSKPSSKRKQSGGNESPSNWMSILDKKSYIATERCSAKAVSQIGEERSSNHITDSIC